MKKRAMFLHSSNFRFATATCSTTAASSRFWKSTSPPRCSPSSPARLPTPPPQPSRPPCSRTKPRTYIPRRRMHRLPPSYMRLITRNIIRKSVNAAASDELLFVSNNGSHICEQASERIISEMSLATPPILFTSSQVRFQQSHVGVGFINAFFLDRPELVRPLASNWGRCGEDRGDAGGRRRHRGAQKQTRQETMTSLKYCNFSQ